MSQINRPVRAVNKRASEVVVFPLHDCWFLDATRRWLDPEEIVAALNAQPDAGDVEAWADIAQQIEDLAYEASNHPHDITESRIAGRAKEIVAEAIARESALRAERDAAAAEAATLRGALERLKLAVTAQRNHRHSCDECGNGNPCADTFPLDAEYTQASLEANAALATPLSPAAERLARAVLRLFGDAP